MRLVSSGWTELGRGVHISILPVVVLSLLLLWTGSRAEAQTQTGGDSTSESAPSAERTQTASRRGRGRVNVSFYSNRVSSSGPDSDFSSRLSEVITSVRYQMPAVGPNDVDYAIDARFAGYPGGDRSSRSSIYQASVGKRFNDGRVVVRGGQMWLQNLGGLGSVGGVLGEYRMRASTPLGRPRVGAFAGFEPEVLNIAYVEGIRKTGGYVAFEGAGRRRHSFGYINLRNSGMTERSVVSMMNFIPVGRRFFLYQASQYDLSGSAGNGQGRLTYFLTNARHAVTSMVEVSGSYHRGRSIDARTITNNILAGRPVSSRMLEGLLFESASARVTARPARGVRFFVGYAGDKNNRNDQTTRRINLGGHVSDLFRSGFDLSVYQARRDRGAGRYNSWDVSVGRQVGGRLYLRGDYSSALSVFRVLSGSNFSVERRPRTRRFEISGNISLPQRMSLQVTMGVIRDDEVDEQQLLVSLNRSF